MTQEEMLIGYYFNMLNSLRKTISNIIFPVKNSVSLGNQFLKYGGKAMNPSWTQVTMSDKDFYTGYSFAAIRNRANAVAQASIKNVKTKSDKKDFVHPYLDLITSSPTFSNYDFWSDISTYIDLEGIYYLLVLRNKEGKRIGDVQEFKMLNPYDIKRVVKLNEETGEIVVGGYIENRNGFTRNIPAEMIIEMKELNPFNPEDNFAMTDAAKESQFTLKTAGDHTRHALKHNINSPGIISTDVILGDVDFLNFKKRISGHVKGEPIFANGKGAINWESMSLNLSKSGLKEVNEINRDVLFAVMGVSKTLLGIEQSGTTRETSKAQIALFLNNHIIPRIQLIIDALDQDYSNNYPEESKKGSLKVDNPTAIDHDADIRKTESLQKESDLYNDLLEKGYDSDKAASFVNGEIGVEELGEPTPPEVEEIDDEDKKEESIKKCSCGKNNVKHDHIKKNIISEEDKGLVLAQQGSLENAVINIDQQLVAESLLKVSKTFNAIEDQQDVLGIRVKNSLINELELVLTGFYGIIITLQGSKIMQKRIGKYALPGLFKLDRIAKKNIKRLSKKVAESHINTVADDIFKVAREEALKGSGLKEIERVIKNKYNETVATTRAKAISRTETNRAFTQAQFDADRQFIKQNKLESRAFKQWVTRGDDPCPFCLELQSRKPIPFNTSFQELGTTLTVDGKKLPINFEALEAGNAHTNCSCVYELIILSEKNSIVIDRLEKNTEESDKLLKQIKVEKKQTEEKLEEANKSLKKIDNLL